MKNKIFAGLAVISLLATSAAYAGPPSDSTPITDQEVAARSLICLKLAKGELTPSQVITGMELDTVRKQRDFALQCRMLMMGLDVGSSAANEKPNT